LHEETDARNPPLAKTATVAAFLLFSPRMAKI